jgi:hypothetical protein
MKHLIDKDKIDKVVFTPSKLEEDHIWLPERPEKTIQKGLFFKKTITLVYHKPEGFYFNGEYHLNYIPKNSTRYIIDLDTKTIRTRPEIFIRYKDDTCRTFYYNTNEQASKVFEELKKVTNLFEIESN